LIFANVLTCSSLTIPLQGRRFPDAPPALWVSTCWSPPKHSLVLYEHGCSLEWRFPVSVCDVGVDIKWAFAMSLSHSAQNRRVRAASNIQFSHSRTPLSRMALSRCLAEPDKTSHSFGRLWVVILYSSTVSLLKLEEGGSRICIMFREMLPWSLQKICLLPDPPITTKKDILEGGTTQG